MCGSSLLHDIIIIPHSNGASRCDSAITGGLHRVVRAMTSFPSALLLHEAAASVLCNCSSNPVVRNVLISDGAVIAVIASAVAHASVPAVQVRCLAAMANIANDNPGSSQSELPREGDGAATTGRHRSGGGVGGVVIEAGALRVAWTAMDRHRSSVEVQSAACALLQTLTSHAATRRVVAEGRGDHDAVRLLSAALAYGRSDKPVQV